MLRIGRLQRKLAMFATVLFASISSGCPGHAQRGELLEEHVTAQLDDFLDDIDANDAQRQRIHQIKQNLLEEAKAAREKSKEARLQGLQEWTKDKPDAKKIHALIDARMDDGRAIIHKVADALIEIHGVLTPTQRSKVTKRIERRLRRH